MRRGCALPHPLRTALTNILKQFDQFVDRLGAAALAIAQAILGIAFEHNTVGTRQCLPDGRDLMHNLATIAAILNHALNAAHLALDAPQTAQHLVTPFRRKRMATCIHRQLICRVWRW